MWFVLALVAMFCWSGSDLFSKVGSRPDDKYSHWKMVIAVGLVMGLHAVFEMTVGGYGWIGFDTILYYLPASAMYILSMVFGYVGLRYIELSVSSPICNSSGALAAILCFIFLADEPGVATVLSVVAVGAGVILLGVVEMRENDESRAARQLQANVKYSKSWLALLLPVLYCIIDALGTFIDCVILREEDTGTILDVFHCLEEGEANVAYELTFFVMGVIAAVYVFAIRRERVRIPRERPKLIAGVCETAGQLAYVYAIGYSDNTAGPAAAIISAYCAVSVLWSRIFLKEKLTWKHYAAIALAFIGIICLGFLDP